ncbi:MAG: nucleoside recognition domain-containing protein, partial [Endomicrobiia bacterium]|nr:nucleoside recognition domain-containing protein [Endomicrobiia bacterium]
AAATLYLMYLFVGVFAAGTLVDLFEEKIFGGVINPFFKQIFNAAGIPEGGFARDIFVGEYGLITMALTYAVAIVFPIVGAFFIFFGALEDSGYLPRLAALLDKFFKKIGLNGKAVLPMVLGLGCDTMATLTTRILEKPRERIIATLLLALAIPCSAQLGVILGILGSSGPDVFLIWLGTIVSVFAAVGYLVSRLLPGASSCFIMEIPPLRMPYVGNILMKVKQRVLWYLMEAVPLFIAGTLALFLLDRIGALDLIVTAMSPAVKGVLGLPVKTAEAFLVGFFRRDYGAAGLYEISRQGLLDKRQTAVSLVTITLFVPCLAQFLVMIKERGKKVAAAIFAFVMVFSFTVGGLLNAALKLMNF